MSADSQPVEIVAGANRVIASRGWQRRNPIVVRTGGGFVGVVGFAGTEELEGRPTADWLQLFNASRPDADVETFCTALAETLTETWERRGLRAVLEILVTGEYGSLSS